MVKKIVTYTLSGILLIGIGGVAYLYFRKPAMAPPSTVRAEITPARLARGKYLFHSVCDCVGCHSERDFKKFGGPSMEGTIGKGFVFPAELGFPGTVVSANITSDKETGLGAWTDGEKVRAIREGISRNGRMLFPLMPYPYFRRMSDEDAYSLVAYMNTLAPVNQKLPTSQINFPVSLLLKSVPQPAGNVPDPDHSSPVKYGEYLATLGGCVECHTPMVRGQIVAGKEYSGGREFNFGIATVVSANITPDSETGIGKWTEERFLDRFYMYKEYAVNGPPEVTSESFTLMPWLVFSQMAPEDLKAIFAFLKTQPPIKNEVTIHPLRKKAS